MSCAQRTWLLCILILLACAGLAVAADQAQVRIASPAPGLTVSEESVAVKVLFSAPADRKVDLVELKVDGAVHASRTISPAAKSGTCTLQWDTAGFSSGRHVLSAVVRDTTGAMLQDDLSLALARPQEPESGFSLAIIKPEQGATVSGTTEVKVRAQHASGVQYVMLFVDDSFTFMTNKEPYAYQWDTRRVVDGEHTLTARAQAGSGQEATSERAKVTVRNTPEAPAPQPTPAPSGRPEKLSVALMADVRPMARAVAAGPVHSSGARAGSRQSAPAAGSIRLPEGVREAPRAQVSAPSARIAPGSSRPRVADAAAPSGGDVAAAKARPAVPAAGQGQRPAIGGVAASAKPAVSVGGTRAPSGAITALGSTLRRAPVASPAAGTVGVRPAPTMGDISSIGPVPSKAAIPPQPAQPITPRLTGANKPVLYLDGQRVETDPTLSLREGIAVGPFRSIVEHCGGSVGWDGGSRTVSASLLARDMRLVIGDTRATVDERPFTLDIAPYLEKNRTMVPLRFFRDALYFTVEYDPASGRYCIYR